MSRGQAKNGAKIREKQELGGSGQQQARSGAAVRPAEPPVSRRAAVKKILSLGPAAPTMERLVPASTSAFGGPLAYWAALTLLVALTVGDSVLAVVLFDLYDERLALFVNQGTAFVYICASFAILAGMRASSRSKTTPSVNTSQAVLDADGNLTGPLIEVHNRALPAQSARRTAPWQALVLIGVLNGSANFCQAIAQPHTPGLVQTLLQLLGIPLVLFLAWLLLRRRPSLVAVAGALLIVGGTAVSSLRTVIEPDDDSGSGSDGPIVVYSYSILLFASAQVFAAVEKVFEERIFGDFERLHAMVMFCWTLCTQFLLGWALYPIQTLPQFGNLSLSELPDVVRDGVLCTVGHGPGCGASHAAVFWAYCTVDFWCYYFGLWVIQRGGASLMVLSSAIALPLQQLVLCSPLVGKWSESFFYGDGIALALVLVGFGVYQACSPEGRAARGESS